MIIKTGKDTNLDIISFECLSSDNLDLLITQGVVTMVNLGSQAFVVNTSDVHKLNTNASGTKLQWYKL